MQKHEPFIVQNVRKIGSDNCLSDFVKAHDVDKRDKGASVLISFYRAHVHRIETAYLIRTETLRRFLSARLPVALASWN